MVARKKVSDIIAEFLASKDVRHVFAISGGASLHLIHSIADHPYIDYICNHHEQASAMCADACSRITGRIGVVVATSGPGATNLITGLCCSYYDSIPVLAITGQVSTTRMVGNTGVRQIGFQETPIIDMCKAVTKYSVQIKEPRDILYELEKSYNIAVSGRPGPVLIDIPDNLQREFVDCEECAHYCPPKVKHVRSLPNLKESADFIVDKLRSSARPVIIAGSGVRIASFDDDLISFAERLNIPIALTWGVADLLPYSHPLYIGTFGTHGQRHANFAVQNADLVISFGSRLDTKSTGSPINTFARKAVRIAIDVDANELLKFEAFGLHMDRLVEQDLRDANLDIISSRSECLDLPPKQRWLEQIQQWRMLFDNIDNEYREKLAGGKINPYRFFNSLSRLVTSPANIFFDTGCSIAWGMQSMQLNRGTRLFHDFNNTAMGWALPAAIASAICEPERKSICITGDGSLMMSLHELAVVKRYGLPIKVFVINNGGYSMIQQTQDQWLNSRYVASSYDGGLAFPEYRSLAQSFSLGYFEAETDHSAEAQINQILNSSTATLCNLHVSSTMRVVPQVKAGHPNEEMEPVLTQAIFKEQMLIE